MTDYQSHFHHIVRAYLESFGDWAASIPGVRVTETEYGLILNSLPEYTQQNLRSVMASYKSNAPRDSRERISARYVEYLQKRTSRKEAGVCSNDF